MVNLHSGIKEVISYRNMVCFFVFRKTIMENAINNTKALVVVSQDQMLEKLQHSEVSHFVIKYNSENVSC